MRTIFVPIFLILLVIFASAERKKYDCSKFYELSYDGYYYYKSSEYYDSWYDADDACYYCFKEGLADVSNAIVKYVVGYDEVFVGSYDGGERTNDLVWNMVYGWQTVTVRDDYKPRYALCGHKPSYDHHKPPSPSHYYPPPPPPPPPSHYYPPPPPPSHYYPPPPPSHYYPPPPPSHYYPPPPPTHYYPYYPPYYNPCDDFSERILGGQKFWLSDNVLPSWNDAYALCLICFDTGLGNISNEVARTVIVPPNYPMNEIFVGSYDGGDITPNLVWFRSSGALAVVDDYKERKGLCGPRSNPPPHSGYD